MNEVYQRMTPEEALKVASGQNNRGKLKIFIGYAPGVGKTYAMLNEGNRRKLRGEDIILGYAESHGRADTDKQIGSLEVVPRKKIEYSGKVMEEMDTGAIIKRHPITVLVDELAHTNVPGSKNNKRYEDVYEILDAGINVITTLNVQHLESLNDTIKQITGVVVRETIPDGVVAQADEVVAVDITVDALINRLKRGDVYKQDKITAALANFFREGNLNALREISLRQTALEVDEELDLYMKAHGITDSWQTTERIMVCISPSPNAKRLIRRGFLISRRYHCEWFVVAVEGSGLFANKWSQKDKEDLQSNFALAKQLGASVLALKGINIPDVLAKYAKEKHISQIVIGHSEKSPFQSIFTGSTTSKLLSETRNIAIHVIPIREEFNDTEMKISWVKGLFSSALAVSDFWKTASMILIVTLVNLGLAPLIGYQAVGYVYLLSLLVLSLFVSFFHIVLYAGLSALFWNLIFIPPFGSFAIAKLEDLIMNITYIITAIITGYLTNKIRQDERLLSLREARTDTMHRITTIIATANDRYACIDEIEKELALILPGKTKVIVEEHAEKLDQVMRRTMFGSEKEISVAMWTFEKSQPAGWATDTLSFAKGIYFPLKGPSENIGILSYWPGKEEKALSQEARNLLVATANQLAIYLEREILRERSIAAEETKKSEGLYRTILDGITHEIKTPVTSILGIASALENGQIMQDASKRQELTTDLSESAERLNSIATNLLDMSRLTAGVVPIKKDWQEISELVNVCVDHLKRKLTNHKVKVEIEDNLPLVMIDFSLMEEALSNLLVNSEKYAPEGTQIQLKAFRRESEIVLEVDDEGPGVTEDELSLIFEKFYRGKGSLPGGTGLGLSIVKAIVEAHDGKVEAGNRKGGGLRVSIILKVDKQPKVPGNGFE